MNQLCEFFLLLATVRHAAYLFQQTGNLSDRQRTTAIFVVGLKTPSGFCNLEGRQIFTDLLQDLDKSTETELLVVEVVNFQLNQRFFPADVRVAVIVSVFFDLFVVRENVLHVLALSWIRRHEANLSNCAKAVGVSEHADSCRPHTADFFRQVHKDLVELDDDEPELPKENMIDASQIPNLELALSSQPFCLLSAFEDGGGKCVKLHQGVGTIAFRL
mmetsp:Transcript_4867/g.7836  ORF Transcript_4867/g.7836 Transcript_4867/m.7836 type:complete len:217 (-) Transcript_4867:205-855(-)